MRILELLLPKGASVDRSLSPHTIQKIDALQGRMNLYVDKILSPGTSPAGKEFLKSRLRDDYYELRELIPQMHAIAEETSKGKANPNQQLSLYNPNGATYRQEKMPTMPDDEFVPLDPDDPELMTFPNDDAADQKKVIQQNWDLLDKREQLVLRYMFWHGMSESEIAKTLGITKERVRQLEVRALRKMKHYFISHANEAKQSICL